MSELGLVLACLRALDIAEATVTLDGSGDSGDATFENAVTRSGETIEALPCLTVDLTGSGPTLADLICNVATEIPDGNWYDNEGGYGTVTFWPFEDDPDRVVDCDITYRDTYPGEEEDDFEDEDEPNQPEPDAVIDSPVTITFPEGEFRS
jgi:hypothetical protein